MFPLIRILGMAMLSTLVGNAERVSDHYDVASKVFDSSYWHRVNVFDADHIQSQGQYHVRLLDEIVDLRSLNASKSRETEYIEDGFKQLWGDDLGKMVKALTDLSPQYSDRDAVLSDAAVKESFLKMTQKSFLAIGPLASEVRSVAGLMRKAEILEEATCATAEMIAGQAAEVVAFKYVIEHTENIWAKLTTPADCAEAVKKLWKALDYHFTCMCARVRALGNARASWTMDCICKCLLEYQGLCTNGECDA